MTKFKDALNKITEDSRLENEVVSVNPDFKQAAAANPGKTAEVRRSGRSRRNARFVKVNRDSLRSEGLLAPEDQGRYMADQYRIIKRPLLDNAMGKNAYQDSDANLIMVGSALPGDGKTFSCINLALSMAVEKDLSVLLVDADVAKPHISRLFGIDAEDGLIELVSNMANDIEDLTIDTDVPGLSLLPAGRRHDHATELLASRRMADIVAELSASDRNRVVIFDSPPLLPTSEARVLAGLMGQIVMIVCAGKTPQQAVIDALASIDESKATNLVLNQAGAGLASEKYGSYGYGYGYGE